jgi:hypothetical protein
LEKERLSYQKEIDWFRARSKDDYDKQMLGLEKQRVQLEGLQLIDANKNNDEIKNT